MRKEYLAEEFAEAYNDYREYVKAVLELLENPALKYLILGIVEKTERRMEITFELRRNGMSVEEAFRIYKNMV